MENTGSEATNNAVVEGGGAQVLTEGGQIPMNDADRLADIELLERMGIENPEEVLGLAAATDPDEEDGGAPNADPVKPDTTDVPQTLKIGDAELPVAEVEAAYSEHQAWKEQIDPVIEGLQKAGLQGASVQDLVDGAVTHLGYVHHFNSGAEGALEVIDSLVESAIEAYGPDVDGRVEKIDPRLLDPTQMSGTELRLYAALKVAQKENAQLRGDREKMAEEGKDLVGKVTELETAPLLARHVNTVVDGAKYTGDEIRVLIKEYSLPFTKEGAVNAVRLAELAKPKDDKGSKPDGEKPTDAGGQSSKANLPKGAAVPTRSEGKEVDMSKCTIEEMNRLLQLGFTHVPGAAAAATAVKS